MMPKYAQLYATGSIHVEQPHCCSPRRGGTNYPARINPKVLRPTTFTGMKKRYHYIRGGIDASEIGTLECVAPITSQGQILRPITATVLPSANMLNVE